MIDNLWTDDAIYSILLGIVIFFPKEGHNISRGFVYKEKANLQTTPNKSTSTATTPYMDWTIPYLFAKNGRHKNKFRSGVGGRKPDGQMEIRSENRTENGETKYKSL